MKHPEFLKKIDWKLLREQKFDIGEIKEYLEIERGQYDKDGYDYFAKILDGQINSLGGVISLIDAIQDYAVDSMGMNEEEIFNLTEE